MDTSTSSVEHVFETPRLATLLRQAPLEYARVVYGLNDHASGRTDTTAAAEVMRTERQGMRVTRERAEQRARAYLPVAGHEHCPRCWVFSGVKHLLTYTMVGGSVACETAKCHNCGAEYCTLLG